MAKEIQTFIKLQVKGGQANPAPPIGPALGSKGVNIMEFCKRFNAVSQDRIGKVLPVVITVYTDKSFDFIVKTPPVHALLMEYTKKQAGSAEPNRKKIGTVSTDIIRRIATEKMPDLNCFTVEAAMNLVAGSAKSAGFNVEGYSK